MTSKYNTTASRTTRRASGMGFKADEGRPCQAIRVCEHCGKPLVKRRKQCRFCNSSCQAAEWDKTHNRTTHAAKGGKP